MTAKTYLRLTGLPTSKNKWDVIPSAKVKTEDGYVTLDCRGYYFEYRNYSSIPVNHTVGEEAVRRFDEVSGLNYLNPTISDL